MGLRMWLLLSQPLPLFSLIKRFRGWDDTGGGLWNIAVNLHAFPDCGMSLPYPPWQGIIHCLHLWEMEAGRLSYASIKSWQIPAGTCLAFSEGYLLGTGTYPVLSSSAWESREKVFSTFVQCCKGQSDNQSTSSVIPKGHHTWGKLSR